MQKGATLAIAHPCLR